MKCSILKLDTIIAYLYEGLLWQRNFKIAEAHLFSLEINYTPSLPSYKTFWQANCPCENVL
jgi:hypothetical protein